MKLQKVRRPTKPSCCIWSLQNQRRDSASGRRGCIGAGYPRKARENKRSHTDSISPSLAALHKKNNFALIRSLASLIVSMVAMCFW